MNPYLVAMSEKPMPPATRLTIEDAKLSEVAARLFELDPGARYRVMIEKIRTREQILADFDSATKVATPDPLVEGLSEDEVMNLIDAEIAASRRERRDSNSSQ